VWMRVNADVHGYRVKRLILLLCMCMCMCMYVCMYVCVRERERERETDQPFFAASRYLCTHRVNKSGDYVEIDPVVAGRCRDMVEGGLGCQLG
jgi:hypothetical protein